MEKKKLPNHQKSVKKEAIAVWNSVIHFMNQNVRILAIVILLLIFIMNAIVLSQTRKIQLSDGKEVIASIDGQKVVAEEVFEAMKEHYGTITLLNIIDEMIANKEVTNLEELEVKAKEEVAELRSQYETYGYDFDEVLSNYGYANEEALCKEILIDLKKETVVKNYLIESLTEEEIEDYYENEVTDRYTVKHILIEASSEDADTMAEAKKKAEEVIQKLQNGEDWSTLVQEYSDDTGSVSNDGLIEDFMKGDVVESFYEASVSLEDGAYTSEPVQSTYGYHIIYRISKTDKESLEEIKEELKETIVTKNLENDTTLSDTTWISIRSRYHFTIYDDRLNSLYQLS